MPNTRAATTPRIDNTNPVIATPLPVSWVGFRLICDRPTLEKTMPRTLNSGPPQHIQPPSTQSGRRQAGNRHAVGRGRSRRLTAGAEGGATGNAGGAAGPNSGTTPAVSSRCRRRFVPVSGRCPALRNPLAQLFRRDRSVLFAIGSNDLVHIRTSPSCSGRKSGRNPRRTLSDK